MKRKEMIEKKKRLIMRFLEKNGRSSTSRIASNINSDIFRCKMYLKILLREKKVERDIESFGTYWSWRNY